MAEPRVFTLEERPDLVARLQEVANDESWPEFALASRLHAPFDGAPRSRRYSSRIA